MSFLLVIWSSPKIVQKIVVINSMADIDALLARRSTHDDHPELRLYREELENARQARRERVPRLRVPRRVVPRRQVARRQQRRAAPRRNIVPSGDNAHYQRRKYFADWKKRGAVFDENIQGFLGNLERQVSNELSQDDIQLAAKMYQMGVPNGMIYSIIRFMRNDTKELRIQERAPRDPRH